MSLLGCEQGDFSSDVTVWESLLRLQISVSAVAVQLARVHFFFIPFQLLPYSKLKKGSILLSFLLFKKKVLLMQLPEKEKAFQF